MPRYAITERAGPFVAAHRNTGVGTVLQLTERQAEHELRLGTLVRLPEPGDCVAAEARVEPPAATPEPAITPVREQDNDAPSASRRQKRSTT